MKLFLAYIFAFIVVFNTSASSLAKPNNGEKIENSKQNSTMSINCNSIFTISPEHNKNDFAIEVEEEDEESKGLLATVFIVCYNFSFQSIKATKVGTYFSKVITPSVSRIILLETFRI